MEKICLLEVDNVCQQLDQWLEKEYSTFDNSTLDYESVDLDIKNVETNVLIEVMRYCLTNEKLVNNKLLANVNILVNGYNTLDDALFESEMIAFKDLEQLLDVKLALQSEIKQFQTNAIYWYLCCVYSMHKVEYTYLDQISEIPNVFRKFLMGSNMMVISQMFGKANAIDTSSLKLVENGYPVISELSTNMAISSSLLQIL